MFQLCDTALLYVKYFCPSIKMGSKRALRVLSPVIAAIRLITMIAGIPLAHSLQHVSNTPVRFSSSLTAEQFNFIRLFFYFRSPTVMSEYVSPPHGETLCSSLRTEGREKWQVNNFMGRVKLGDCLFHCCCTNKQPFQRTLI